jgi:hypothetical protein
MKHIAAANDRHGIGKKASRPSADYCPASDLPVLEDTDPTMPVLALTEEKENYGYDPYDTGSFWAAK